MAVIGGITGSSCSQVALTGGATSSTTTSGKTNSSTNTGTTANMAVQTGNTASSQNTSGVTGAANAGTKASNSASSGGNTTNITVAPSIANKTGAISLQEAEAQRVAAQKAAEEAARKAAEEAARKAAEEAARKAAEAARKVAEEAARKAAEEAARKAAEEAARKAAEEAAKKEQARLAWESEQKAIAERAQREAAQKAAAEEAFRKSEAEEAQKRAYKAELADAARKTAEQEENLSFKDAVISIYERSRKYSQDVQAVEQQVLLEQVEMVGTTMNQLWNNYMRSMEQNQATTLATAEGINQWGKIIKGDASDLTEEQREYLHAALDVMSMLPGGGVYDWLNAELYAAEGNTEMAAVSTLAVAVPGVLPALNQAAKHLTNGSDLLSLIFKSGSMDEVAEGMIKHGDEMQEAGEILAKEAAEGGGDVFKFNNWDDMKDAYKGTITQFVKENKPKYSPDIKKWFDNGGSIEIQNIDGKQVWTYTSSAGDSVPYIDGYIKFPDEYLNPTIKSVDIGEFTGDRGKDIDKMLSILEEDYGITEIPEGYIVHHDIENGILQLVDENIHTEFTHIGGHSIYK